VSESDNFGSKSRFELAQVALGQAEADLALVNGSLVNVYTAEILEGSTILVKGDRVAYAGRATQEGIGPNTRIIDVGGKVLIPGLIDGHTHTDYIYSSHELVRYAIMTGTTAIITDVVEMTFALGYPGLREFLKSVRHQPVKYFITVPPMVTISPIAREHILTLAQIRSLFREKDVPGLGEIYWGPLLAGEKYQQKIMEEASCSGKVIEGHAAGAGGNKLQAYTALGVTSDHEPITPGEVLERLRLGMSVMIREGEIRRDLAAVSQIKDQKIDFRRLAVSTDGIGPVQLTTQGFMDFLLQETIDQGFPAVQAVQMATLNVAEHFHLDNLIGGIAPGRLADIVVVPTLAHIKPELVISNGQIVFSGGEIKVPPRHHTYARFTFSSINLEREMEPADFVVLLNNNRSTAKIRVIDQVTNLLTREIISDLPVAGGQVLIDAAGDIIKVTAIERRHTPGKLFTGFIRGLGLRRGAIATSTCWDCTDIVVVGTTEDDMAHAVNRIRELRGGMVICLNGQILEELEFPVGGMISTLTMEKLAEKLSHLQKMGMELGCSSPDIRTTLSVLTTAAIPYLRICESGLFNLRSNSLVDLIVE
jgi:adenine deaminase